MQLTPIEFIEKTQSGIYEVELNNKENYQIDESELRQLVKKYGHTVESAKKHLLTDYSNGYTICSECGSFYELGKGFTKHISKGCLHCEGESRHKKYFVQASEPKYGGFPARWMSVMFDDGMSYCVDKLQVEKFKELFVSSERL